ncbi:MAG: hypothetical protein QOE70_5024 [Chthoniobacter sp.]|nr:hypothetical protein [Chthoniobacter sp.]
MLGLPMKPFLLVFLAALALRAFAAEPKVDFNYDIRPIISSKCFACHGADEKSRKAKLRLDIREEALKERDGVRAIVPGDLEASDLVVRIESKDKDEVMPPPKEAHPLTRNEIALLKKWVEQGAEYKEHWSFTKPVRPAVPRIESAQFSVLSAQSKKSGAGSSPLSTHPIDAFVWKKLEQQGLAPSPEADRPTLIRRVSLDLTGLPPTPEEVGAFVNDPGADAYERLVDRLLASPAFGERWAKMWLDLARYADSTGYGSDKFRLNIWPYRDWVINAFNRNLPYDQFTIEQLAGDLLPNATPDQIAATAFHRNTMTNVEGGTIDEEYRVAAVKDRIATTGQVWMGLTVGCAQCHTHKFDPIAHKDYYAFYGIFNQTADSDREDEEPKLPLPTAEELAKTSQLKEAIAQLEKTMKGSTPELEAEQHAWEAQMAQPAEWQTLTPFEIKAESGTTLAAQADGSFLAIGSDRPDADTYTFKMRLPPPGKLTAFRLEALPDDSLPSHGPGRADNGNAVLSELRVTAGPSDAAPARGRFVRVTLPNAPNGLALAEVQVFSKGENLAVKGVAAQSSTDFGGDAKRANDGRTDGAFTANSVSHTGHDQDTWWEVDLREDADIDSVVIWNRTDADLESRLANFRVSVLDAAHQPVWEETVAEPPRPSVTLAPDGSKAVALRRASADFSQDGFAVATALDGNARTGWAFVPELGRPHAAVFETAAPVDPAGSVLTFTLLQRYGQSHTLGRFRLSATTTAPPPIELPAQIKAILAVEPSERAPEQRDQLTAFFRSLSRTFAELGKQLEAKRGELAAMKPVMLPVLRELPPEKRRETHIFNKGNYLAPGDKVEPGLLSAFAAFVPAGTKMDRLAAGRWIMSPENPLTARVTVNRFWSQLFGTGIVETEEDFGTQGALPSHPELLDWLAVAFMTPKGTEGAEVALGWDVKELLRLIATSATYRQSSKVTPELLAKDARNRLLARYPRRRLEAETVRDQALALSGLLSHKIGGPSVYPPQPDGLWKVAFNGGQNAYPTSKGENRYRRGLYTFWRRTMPNPSMTTFDAPSRETCTVRRIPTNTPLQAFVTLNDPVFVECAQALARRIVREGGADTAARLRFALQLCLARPPTDAQVQALAALFADELATYRADLPGAAKLATEPLGPLPDGADAAEMAAWTVVANVLLNLDGVLTKS